MALTVALVPPVQGPQYALGMLNARTFDITFDNSYTTGGLALDPIKTLGFETAVVTYITEMGVTSTATTAVSVHYNRGTSKLQAFNNVAGTPIPEVAAAVDLSTFTVRITFLGY